MMVNATSMTGTMNIMTCGTWRYGKVHEDDVSYEKVREGGREGGMGGGYGREGGREDSTCRTWV